MDTNEFKKALAVLVKEKGISEEIVYDAMELALTSAYKKNYHSLSNVRVGMDHNKGIIHVYSFKTVVLDEEHEAKEPIMIEVEDEDSEEEGKMIEIEKPYLYDERIHITLEEAQKIVPKIKIGETIEEEVTPRDFGRVAAATAKQVVIQKIKEAEKNLIVAEFENKQDEMISGTVAMEDIKNYYIDLGRTQGILPKTEIIPGEKIKMGSNIKIYVSKVENTTKGPFILLSRSHYGFVKRLFELEIPEINEGLILVYSVAREAGVRTKIAVMCEKNNIDAVGSCIGERGSRIANILKELGPEKVDIVLYDKDKAKFIENALSPAKNLHVYITDEKNQESLVVVDGDDLSLAIGKKGLNVRLASRLTKFKIDIKTYEQAREMGINIVD
ncbi:MAG: transcription termination factor NusA [Bacilli bacterium]